jgi:uncharacterized protein (DUF433 family)
MELESFFDLSDADEIRIRGKRIGIETVLEDYLEGATPEEIAARYRSLTLEEVYATILYYHHKKAEIDAYLESCRIERERAWADHERNVTPPIRRLRELKRQRSASETERAAP